MMLQLENGKGNVGVYRTLSSMVRGAGLGALYRGLASPVFMEVPKRWVWLCLCMTCYVLSCLFSVHFRSDQISSVQF